jgi:hypothetical protein
MDKRVNPSAQDNKAIISPSGSGFVQIVKLLMADERVDLSDQNNLAIIRAASKNNYDNKMFWSLLGNQVLSPLDPNNSAIITAASKNYYYNKFRVVKILLKDTRVNPSAQNNLTIINAARLPILDIAILLMNDPRVDPSDQNNRVLNEVLDPFLNSYAYITDNTEIISLLLENDLVIDRLVINPVIKGLYNYKTIEELNRNSRNNFNGLMAAFFLLDKNYTIPPLFYKTSNTQRNWLY